MVGLDRGKRRGTAKEIIERKEKEKAKAKAKAKEKKGKKVKRKARARTTAGKETVAGGRSNVRNGGLNRFVATVDTVGNGATRMLNAINGKDDDRWNLEQ